jgi:uncharacterized membrane protein
VSEYDWLLFVHVSGAFLLVAGAVVAGVVQLSTLGRERPSEIALLMSVTRRAVGVLGVGSLLTLVFGIWLAENRQYGVTDEWVLASIALWVLSQALGGAGGRMERHTRELAERLAAAGDAPSPELRLRLRDPRALALSYSSSVALIAILVLMVWKPGAY